MRVGQRRVLQSSVGTRSEVPGAVEQVLRNNTGQNTVRSFLGIGLVGEAFSGGLRQIGMDAELSLRVFPRFELMGHVGGRTARSVSSDNGRVTADGWLAGVGGKLFVFAALVSS